MSERSEAKRIGAKLHPNSGRGTIKGDMSTDLFVIDSKEYTKAFTITTDNWAKICSDTMSVSRSKSPMLYLVLNDNGRKTRLAVIEYSILEELLERVKNGNND